MKTAGANELSRRATRLARFAGGELRAVDDWLAVEEPLEMAARFRGKLHPLGVTLRTPGADRELVLGYLFSEGAISEASQVKGIKRREATKQATMLAERVTVALADDAPFDPGRLERVFPISAACGACGRSALEALRIERVEPFELGERRLKVERLMELGERLREGQAVFADTGGLHAAGCFDWEGELMDQAEDVGRHNALDKLIGRSVEAGVSDWSDRVLVLSGRIGFDLMQKAIRIGCAAVVGIGAPSSLAVELAGLLRMTLVGFLRPDRFNIYCGPERIEFGERRRHG